MSPRVAREMHVGGNLWVSATWPFVIFMVFLIEVAEVHSLDVKVKILDGVLEIG